MPRTTKIQLKCHHCKSAFSGFPTQNGRSEKRYCSKRCTSLARVTMEVFVRECKQCAKQYDTKDVEQKFCTPSCYHLWMTGKPGRKASEETRKKLSDAQKGKKKNISPEGRARQTAALSGPNNKRWVQDRDALHRRQKIAKIWRAILYRNLRQFGQKKSQRTVSLLGYSSENLREHIEQLWKPGMNWGNYGSGPGKWQIDHRRPVSSFELDVSPAIVNALDNLQPLWYEENMTKFVTWDKE